MKRSPDIVCDPAADGARRNQVGALCWRMADTQVEVLLVTSRETGRWVIPKGWPIEGRAPSDAAAREAWEEAGVRGRIADECLGVYAYDKVLGRDGMAPQAVPCVVTVFPMQVSRCEKAYPEATERRQKWFPRDKAALKVVEPDLAALIAGFNPRQPA